VRILNLLIYGTVNFFVSVATQLGKNPLAVNRFLVGVMKNVNLPKAQQDFTIYSVHESK